MTLAISSLTSSGIVLTTDSRQTYRNQAGAIRVGSDSATKLFKLADSCGVAISGRAFLNETNQPVKDAGFFVRRFAESEELSRLTVKQIAEKLNKCIGDIFVSRELEGIKKQIENRVKELGGTELTISPPDGNLLPYSFKDKDGKIISDNGWVETLTMIVAGIDSDKIGRAYIVSVPKGITNERDTQQCGALWVGQTDVLGRIVKGFAPEIGNLDFVKAATANDSAGVSAQLEKLEYIINWGTITLQDAVDFCVLMTRTTASIQRFSDGTRLTPGGIPGVGGEIDIAVITPEKGFVWLKQKTLKSEDTELSLDSLPSVQQDQSPASG
jgi:hypothetical protein